MNVLIWHVHGSWMSAMVQGGHRYLVPVNPSRDHWGRGKCGRSWPAAVVEVSATTLPRTEIDVMVLQRPEEIELAQRWTGRTPGIDVPAIYVEHNTPRGDPASTRHPLADGSAIPIAHVTHFNRMMWDNGIAPTFVIPHGIADPGRRYTGTCDHAVTMINEPVRRGRITGTDLLVPLSAATPIDVFGMGTDELDRRLQSTRVHGCGDWQGSGLYDRIAERRVFVHVPRWTSLGLSLIEAMQLGMPIVALGTTEAHATVPPEAGVVSTDIDELTDAIRFFVRNPHSAATAGAAAREAALARHGLGPFVRRWDTLISELSLASTISGGQQR